MFDAFTSRYITCDSALCKKESPLAAPSATLILIAHDNGSALSECIKKIKEMLNRCMADPDLDFGIVYDEQGFIHILHSTFFDVDPEIDHTVEGYVERILDTLAEAIEEQLGNVQQRIATGGDPIARNRASYCLCLVNIGMLIKRRIECTFYVAYLNWRRRMLRSVVVVLDDILRLDSQWSLLSSKRKSPRWKNSTRRLLDFLDSKREHWDSNCQALGRAGCNATHLEFSGQQGGWSGTDSGQQPGSIWTARCYFLMSGQQLGDSGCTRQQRPRRNGIEIEDDALAPDVQLLPRRIRSPEIIEGRRASRVILAILCGPGSLLFFKFEDAKISPSVRGVGRLSKEWIPSYEDAVRFEGVEPIKIEGLVDEIGLVSFD
ncbi:hypothetical protein IEQ34_018279 [Dendrobium chrysotoxum]|uniref:Uncharacterized protein n=1 Tax=Dendrobium chrysotoxum TaxID=161865 RepID=A0AAV7GCM1_DENCH|nr:hypothetical protein IEQ34_018279 [Dendrobium chrysotoxum]